MQSRIAEENASVGISILSLGNCQHLLDNSLAMSHEPSKFLHCPDGTRVMAPTPLFAAMNAICPKAQLGHYQVCWH
ncbi:MAG: hypothetical protein CM1200mP27_04150 [Chloroflexota bacterium]|nr:MAG: hypothetical protein CM1200mP27_04150 [Chloroflexota bacterium]